MNQNTFDSLCQSINDNPEDTYRWLVLADYLEEQGDKRADGLRWLVEKGKEPTKTDRDGNKPKYRWSGLGDGAYKYYESLGTKSYKLTEKLPIEWFPIQRGWDYHGFYETLSDAILCAAEKFSIIGVNENGRTTINH